MNVPTCFVLVGLPGSGKSYKANELAIEYEAEIFSSDALRTELFGDVNNQADNQMLFTKLHRRIKDCLRRGKSAIFDATNISYKKRMAFLAELKNIPCEKICVLMATPYEECLKRNAERERNVPEHVIKRMYTNFNIPYWYEGWDCIHIVYSYDSQNSYGNVCDWVESVMDYDQHNRHHSLTLGQHCMATFQNIYGMSNRFWEITTAALIHDCGKPKTATYINSKGEKTEECHYYQHNFTGAYDSLFFGGITDHLYVAQLIQWHMHPYTSWKQSEKAKERDKKILGDTLFYEILRLHEADVTAH